jgi:hypothetical protein
VKAAGSVSKVTNNYGKVMKSSYRILKTGFLFPRPAMFSACASLAIISKGKAINHVRYPFMSTIVHKILHYNIKNFCIIT